MFALQPEPPLTPEERLRRVARLFASFMRNLAFHRAGMEPEPQRKLLPPFHPHAAFWREAHANFIDMCVLEWCKLFVDRNRNLWGHHHWRRVVSDPAAFEAALYASLAVSADQFDAQVQIIRRYRNKFVAHLDAERNMHLPFLDIAERSVVFYHEHVVMNEARPGDLRGLADTPEKLVLGYEQCLNEARSVYRHALTFSP